jgi:hypothetical protein
MTGSISGSVSRIGTLLIGFSAFGACSSDEEEKGKPADAGTDRRSTGGSGGLGSGGSGAVDSGETDAGCLAVSTACDGAEDCGAGQRCCARFEGQPPSGRYVEFGCFDSCNAAGDDGGGAGTWLELCHAGDTCEDAALICTTSDFLPSSLARCFDVDAAAPDPGLSKTADAINCGTEVCGTGEQCCIRQPLEPYCALASEACQCERPEPDGAGGSAGGPGEGGADAPEGGDAPDGDGTAGSPPDDAAGDADSGD